MPNNPIHTYAYNERSVVVVRWLCSALFSLSTATLLCMCTKTNQRGNYAPPLGYIISSLTLFTFHLLTIYLLELPRHTHARDLHCGSCIVPKWMDCIFGCLHNVVQCMCVDVSSFLVLMRFISIACISFISLCLGACYSPVPIRWRLAFMFFFSLLWC